ncbi:MAG: hypothetical protein IKK06_05980 [Clostridia bacterium]|nr:hypothetical protein [Clostridia bacterium]MBR4054335.1 hypothetical protein [Clostridia bacterium]
MKFEKHVDFLLKNACTSIKFLVHRDLLHTSRDEPFMQEMRKEILLQENVRKHLNAQFLDGWFGTELHGGEYSMERSIGTLLDAGIEKEHPAIQQGIHALLTPSIASNHKNWFHGGDGLDAEGRGGNNAIVAQILSWVGYDESYPLLAEQIALSWEHLSAVPRYTSVEDFTKKGKNQRYYKPNARFPGANHISLLNATQSWRTEERMVLAKEAAGHAYELMKDVDEFITFKKPAAYGGSFVGPFNYNWKGLKPVDEAGLYEIINHPYNFEFAFWLGFVAGVPDWVRQDENTYYVLADFLERADKVDVIPERVFSAFRRVMGKEPNYRKRTAAQCDLTYALLRAVWNVVE